MLESQFQVNNPKGIHSRVAKEISSIAGNYDSSIKIAHGDEVADAISILEVLSLGIPFATSFSVQVEGSDATEAMNSLRHLFEKTDDP